MEVDDLAVGDLFIWEQQPDYLHEMTDKRDDTGRPYANHVATRSDGVWRFHTGGNWWNQYCDVRKVAIKVE